MENAKQEAVKVAWGKYYEPFKEHIEQGWAVYPHLQIHDVDKEFIKECDIADGALAFRPKSLRGLETNNGWTSIEDDLSNIVEGEFEFLVKKEYNQNSEKLKETIKVTKAMIKEKHLIFLVYSHYKPIQPELLPVY